MRTVRSKFCLQELFSTRQQMHSHRLFLIRFINSGSHATVRRDPHEAALVREVDRVVAWPMHNRWSKQRAGIREPIDRSSRDRHLPEGVVAGEGDAPAVGREAEE